MALPFDLLDSNAGEGVTLSRPGHDTLEVSIEHLTVCAVSRAFSVDPASVWLREEPPGNRAFFPDHQNRLFQFPSDVGITTNHLIVEGSAVTQAQLHVREPASAIISSLPSTSSGSRPTVPYYSSVPKRLSGGSLNLKVIQAEMKRQLNGKADFIPVNQTFVDITDATANVNYITMAIQQKWGEEYVLVTSDGLHIDDSSGTQGMKFWKVGSRKIYAVKTSAIKQPYKRSAITISSSDSDDNLPSSFKEKQLKVEADISKLLADISLVKSDVKSLLEIDQRLQIPIALARQLLEAFCCSICHRIARPPIIYTRCCKYMLGCESCVNTWYGGDDNLTRTCPRCRAERAFSETSRLNGFDELLTSVGAAIQDDIVAD